MLADKIMDDTYRPHTKWEIIGNVNANITLLRDPFDFLIGHLSFIPSFMKLRGMLHFNRHPVSNQIIKDNLCLFRCLSYHLYKTSKHAENLMKQIYPNDNVNTFKGVPIEDFQKIEETFDVNIRVFKLCQRKKIKTKERKKTCVQPIARATSTKQRKSTMCINLYRHHSSLITDMKKYGQIHKCEK